VHNLTRVVDVLVISVVPEPSTLILMGCGGAALLGCWRRRQPAQVAGVK
jgi:hypothetical protein